MSSYKNALEREVQQKLDELDVHILALIDPRHVTTQIMGAHRPRHWDCAALAYWEHCAWNHTRRVVADEIRSRWGGEGADQRTAQIKLPGFEVVHLCPRYIVTRHGVDLAVPVQLMTDEELESRAHLYDAQADTLKDHASELRRYVAMRRAQRSVA